MKSGAKSTRNTGPTNDNSLASIAKVKWASGIRPKSFDGRKSESTCWSYANEINRYGVIITGNSKKAMEWVDANCDMHYFSDF